jgi:glucose-6-phosphate isomerase
MKDAGIEAKRAVPSDSGETPDGSGLAMSLGKYEARVRTALADAQSAHVIERIWSKDVSLWKSEPAHQKIISNSLGWLTVAPQMLDVSTDLKSFANEIRRSNEFGHVMVCGMGGSSLCPEVLRQTFGRQTDSPELLVLDSTDPDAINNFKAQIDINRCLFIIASKSGTTTEPITFHRFWYEEVSRHGKEPGQSFVTITDPGSQMAQTARDEAFRRIFLNQPDIGGRYSALSFFGMVPAALAGLDVQKLLQSANTMAESCAAGHSSQRNPGAVLGAVLAECALAGRDKLTIVTDSKLSALGLWIEQLIAESTGKEGKGIVPIVGETLGAASVYSDDRLFVVISAGPLDGETSDKLKALEAAGHPIARRVLDDAYQLGAEFFLWEMATAFAGWRLGINPFDQPNVQESKDATKALLEKFDKDGQLEDDSPAAEDGAMKVFSGEENKGVQSVKQVLKDHFAKIKSHDYIALLAYVEETNETYESLQRIRTLLRDATGCATTVGYGPRFLHSTGQLHKGGPDSGVFIQITAPDQVDLKVPGEKYTFSVLKQAQAQGDFQSLVAHGRRAIRVDVGKEVVAGLATLLETIAAVLVDPPN